MATANHPERFPYLKWALENATQFTAVSQEGLYSARIISACPSKGRVILNSIRPQDYREGIQDLHLPRPVIGSLAVFKNKKGIEVLLCSFKMLLQRYLEAHLLLVGFLIPEEQARFDTLVDKYNLKDNIALTGRIPGQDALGYLHHLRLPSRAPPCGRWSRYTVNDGRRNMEIILAMKPSIALATVWRDVRVHV
jgi:glycosyltransferase involved in cell wall biosynthesis